VVLPGVAVLRAGSLWVAVLRAGSLWVAVLRAGSLREEAKD